jgi:co-chaperonin GroES (HSP10)
MQIDQIKPRPGWSLCRMVPVTNETESGLYLGRDVEDGKTTEGVCEVLDVCPEVSKDGTVIPPGFSAGDLILFREFLKNSNQVGALVGEKSNRVFLLNNRDALAVIDGSGDGSITLGHYGEYRL